MALVTVAVVAGLNAISRPLVRRMSEPPAPSPVTAGRAPSLEREFLTAVLGRPRVSGADAYCDARGCCPTHRVSWGTTAPTNEVIGAFEVQGYLAQPGDRDVVRPGPFPQARWTAELDYAGRWKWRRVEVSRGADVDRPDWPTVFVESSIACGER
jgi:hypothetical protein